MEKELTAEEFVRNKIREKYNLKGEMMGLQMYDVSGVEALKYAHQFAEQKLTSLRAEVEGLRSEIETRSKFGKIMEAEAKAKTTELERLRGERTERFNSDVFIDNVCISYRHDFGMLSKEEKESTRFECKEWMRAIDNNWKYHKTPPHPTERSEGEWYCPNCKITVPPEQVTFEERHDKEGCFCKVV